MKIMNAILLSGVIVSTSALAITPEQRQELDRNLNNAIQNCDNVSGLVMDVYRARHDDYTMSESINNFQGAYGYPEEIIYEAVTRVYTVLPVYTNRWSIDFHVNKVGIDVYENCMEQVNAVYLVEEYKLERGQ